MRSTFLLPALLLLLPWRVPVSRAETGHEHHHPAPAAKPKAGKKWETDAALRKGMERIREAVRPLSAKAGEAAHKEAAAEIESATEFLFKNCKLAPEADAGLHGLLSEILAGAAQMRGEGEGKRSEGAGKVRAALARYPGVFRHEGW